jgi:hypothetical protein
MMNCNCPVFSKVGKENGLPGTIGGSQVSRIAYTGAIKFKFIKWFRKNPGVSAAEDEQAAGVAMEIDGGGDSGKQVAEDV